MSEMLNVKDLITVGIFAVILTVVIFLFGMLGYIPILMIGLPIIAALVAGLIADVVLKMGNYSSIKNSIISYGFFSLGVFGNMLPFYILRDYFVESIRASMGTDYVNVILPFLTNEMLIVLIIVTFIVGLIGAYIGKLVLKKHFEKAGIA